jgi:hypothetical protein
MAQHAMTLWMLLMFSSSWPRILLVDAGIALAARRDAAGGKRAGCSTQYVFA